MPRKLIPRPLHLANEALAFLLELAALAALAFWGFRAGPNLPAQLALAIGAPVILIVIWALFCAPRARVQLPKAPLMVLRTALLLGSAVALIAAGGQVAAIVFAGLIVLNALITVLDRDALINAPRPTDGDAATRDIPNP